MRSEVIDERREVHCLSASLSEQDFESDCGASERDGFRRTMPRLEKYARPASPGIDCLTFVRGEESVELPFGREGSSHGVGSSWAAIVSSILASPPTSI